jgi:choline-sulfatase
MTKKKKYIKFMIGGAAVLLILFLLFHFLPAREKTRFKRIEFGPDLQDLKNFKLDTARGKVFFSQQGQDIRLPVVSASDACFFKIAGEKKLEMPSPFSGQVGFFCHFYINGLNGEKIQLKIDCLRGTRTLKLLRLFNSEQSLDFARQLELTSGDRIQITFRGNGIIYFSQPLFYRIRPAKERKYVFLIGVDTLRGDHIGMKVNGRSITPRIDSLKQDAAVFSSCFAQSDWTLPSFMSLFTSQYEFNHQIRHGAVLALDKPFLVKELRQRFITFNLNGGGYVSRNFGFSRYFDYFDSSAHYSFPNGGQLLFKDALRLIDSGVFPEAFFFLHTYQVHTPYCPPPKFLHEINPHPRTGKLDSITFESQKKRFIPVAGELMRSYKELYQAEVLAFDSFLGDFIDALKKRGIYQDAMIIVMSDHGEEFFEHGGWGHGHSMYEELLRVPLVIKFPGEEFKGRRVDEPVGVIDIIPSIMDFYGIAGDGKKIDGLSLLPLLKHGKLARQQLFSSVSTCLYMDKLPAKFAVIDGHFKIICNYPYQTDSLNFFGEFSLPPATGPVEIYDLERDRNETRSLYLARGDIYRKLLHVINAIKKRIALNFKMENAGSDAEIDEELKRQMKTLGYL